MEKKIKILHYVTIMNRGGEETFIMNVFRQINLNRFGFDFLCLTTNKGDYDDEIRSLGGKINYIQLYEKPVKFKRIKNYFLLKNYLKKLSCEYDVFHIHTQHAMDAWLDATAAKKAGFKKVIIHSHSTNTLHHRRAHYLFRPFLKYSSFIKLACSKNAGEWLFGKKAKFTVVPNGIITDNYNYSKKISSKIRTVEKWNEKKVIGHVGSFTYPKNHKTIIDIFYLLQKNSPEYILVLVGNGALMNDIKAYVSKLKIEEKVHFLGSRGNVNELMQAMDILLFPSKYEGLPVTLIEAQATGLPCLISDTITNDVIISNNVYKESLDSDPEKWCDDIKKIIKQDTNRKDGYKMVKSSIYDISNTVQILMNIYLK